MNLIKWKVDVIFIFALFRWQFAHPTLYKYFTNAIEFAKWREEFISKISQIFIFSSHSIMVLVRHQTSFYEEIRVGQVWIKSFPSPWSLAAPRLKKPVYPLLSEVEDIAHAFRMGISVSVNGIQPRPGFELRSQIPFPSLKS